MLIPNIFNSAKQMLNIKKGGCAACRGEKTAGEKPVGKNTADIKTAGEKTGGKKTADKKTGGKMPLKKKS